MLDSNWNKLVVCKFYHTAHRFYARVQSSTCTTYDKYLRENKNDRANCEIGYYKGKLSSFIVKKIFIEFRLKSEFFKGFINFICFWLSLYNYKEKLWSFMVKKMFIDTRLCNRMTCFKGHVEIVKIYIVQFNVPILNRLKIMGFL